MSDATIPEPLRPSRHSPDQVRPGPGGPELFRAVVRFTERELQAVDAEAARSGMSRAGVVRRLVREVLLSEADF